MRWRTGAAPIRSRRTSAARLQAPRTTRQETPCSRRSTTWRCPANWPMMGRFYEAVFGLRSGRSRPLNAATVGDGYVGLNINPLRDGYVGGLDHFGMVVDDVNLVLERARKKFPQANIVKRPSTRPFAAYSAHDPDGNVFDLAEKNKQQARRRLRRAGGDRLEAGPLPQQVRHPHHERGKVRGILRRGVRTQAGQHEERRARLPPHRRPRNAVDPAVVDPDIRGHGDQAARPRPYRFQGGEYRRLQARIVEVVGGCSYLAPMRAGRQQRGGCAQGVVRQRARAANSRWPIPAASGSTSPTSEHDARAMRGALGPLPSTTACRIGPASARGADGLFPRQADQAGDRRVPGRRLRRLCAAAGAAHRQIHPRQSRQSCRRTWAVPPARARRPRSRRRPPRTAP